MEFARLPSLLRFLFILCVLGGLGFAGMMALVTLVEPTPREMIQNVPPSRFAK